MIDFKKNRGQAIVEMALILPVLILILCGIFEFGRIFNASLIVTNASREGARIAAVGGSNSDIMIAISNHAVSVLNQASIKVTITPSEINRFHGEQAAVQIDYKVSIITPLISSIIPNPFPISSKTVMRVE